MSSPTIILHRVNNSDTLKDVPTRFGVEIDLRSSGNDIILNHEPFQSGELFKDYLKHYQHNTLILNIKEAGIESEVIRLVQEYNINNYFLLDCEFPYIYRATREGINQIAIRYSEDESIETVKNYKGLANWVWVDTNTCLPINYEITQSLQGFKTCLVCPERWGRPKSITPYATQMKGLNWQPTAIMTSKQHASLWESIYGITN